MSSTTKHRITGKHSFSLLASSGLVKYSILTILLLFVSILFLRSVQKDKQVANSTLDRTQVNRLAELCKIWGQIKYFNPRLSYYEINWDSILMYSIPKAVAAKTNRQFSDVLNQMLLSLNDPETYLYHDSETVVLSQKELARAEIVNDSTVLIKLSFNDLIPPNIEHAVNTIKENIKFKHVVFDLRGVSVAPHTMYQLSCNDFTSELNTVFSRIFYYKTKLLSQRTVKYLGYKAHSSYPSRHYSSDFSISKPESLHGNGKTKIHTPITFLVNEYSYGISSFLSALQKNRYAQVIQVGAAPMKESRIKRFIYHSSGGFSIVSRSSESINNNGCLDFQPDTVVKSFQTLRDYSEILSNVPYVNHKRDSVFTTFLMTKEEDYADSVHPSETLRLLSLFRFWNVIEHFYPNKDIIDKSWDSVLTSYIPIFAEAKSDLDYVLSVSRIMAEINDSHARIVNNSLFENYIGTMRAPFDIVSVNGKSLISNISPLDKIKYGVESGDVVLSIDSEGIDTLRKRLCQFISASTKEGLEFYVDEMLVRGNSDSFTVDLLNRRNEKKRITIYRDYRPHNYYFRRSENHTDSVFRILSGDIGYIDLVRLKSSDVDHVFKKLEMTRGIILDMRGYPNTDTYQKVIDHIAQQTIYPEMFCTPSPSYPKDTSFYRYKILYTPKQAVKYKQKIITLINVTALSHAEEYCLFLKATGKVTFLGSHTNGTLGAVTYLTLAGGITVSVSGNRALFPNGQVLQRVGIAPDISVSLSEEDIRLGRDALVERAHNILLNESKEYISRR